MRLMPFEYAMHSAPVPAFGESRTKLLVIEVVSNFPRVPAGVLQLEDN